MTSETLRPPPPGLAQLKTWVIWHLEPGKDKPRKVPYYAASNTRRKGNQGSDADRAQLVMSDEARTAAARHNAAGVGLAILPDLGIVALDFDNCVEDGRVRDEVLALVSGTYAEFSPSGRGVRAFFKGSLASRKSFAREGHAFDAEVFGDSGFVTYTGNVLPECEIVGNQDTVAELTPEVRAFYEARWGRTATQPTSAPAERDPLDTYEPRLELTLGQMRDALAKLDPDMPEPEWVKVGWAINHETGGSEEGRALWHAWSSGSLSSSGAASKYDERSAEEKWNYAGRQGGRPVTFRSVLKMVKDASARLDQAAKRKRFEVISATEFGAQPLPEWILDEVLPQAALGMVYGESGSGKSFFVLDLVAAITRGVPWRGRTTQQGRTVYVAAEGAGGFRKRVRAYEQFFGAGSLSELGVIGDAPNLLSIDDVGPLTDAVKAFGAARVVVIDTLAQATPGGNENAAEDMGKALSHCRAIHTATGALVLLVHHSGKDAAKGARGWSGIKAACDVEIEITRTDKEHRYATVTKLKDGEDGAVFGFRLNTVSLPSVGKKVLTSCVVHDAPVVKKNKGKARSEVLEIVLRILDAASGLEAQAGVPRDQLVTRTAQELPALPAGKRDQRRQRARQSIKHAIEGGQLVEENGLVRHA